MSVLRDGQKSCISYVARDTGFYYFTLPPKCPPEPFYVLFGNGFIKNSLHESDNGILFLGEACLQQ